MQASRILCAGAREWARKYMELHSKFRQGFEQIPLLRHGKRLTGMAVPALRSRRSVNRSPLTSTMVRGL